MTQEDIIRMAREAGMAGFDGTVHAMFQFERFAALVAAQRPWVGLTDEDIKEIVGPYGDTPIKGYTRKLFDQIEAKLKEKNT